LITSVLGFYVMLFFTVLALMISLESKKNRCDLKKKPT